MYCTVNGGAYSKLWNGTQNFLWNVPSFLDFWPILWLTSVLFSVFSFYLLSCFSAFPVFLFSSIFFMCTCVLHYWSQYYIADSHRLHGESCEDVLHWSGEVETVTATIDIRGSYRHLWFSRANPISRQLNSNGIDKRSQVCALIKMLLELHLNQLHGTYCIRPQFGDACGMLRKTWEEKYVKGDRKLGLIFIESRNGFSDTLISLTLLSVQIAWYNMLHFSLVEKSSSFRSFFPGSWEKVCDRIGSSGILIFASPTINKIKLDEIG